MNLKVISFNVLCGGPDNMFWTSRKSMVTGILNNQHPDSFGVQESHYNWMQTLCEALPDYAYIGVGRDDGKTGGEFSPVFYLKDKFDVVDSGTFWVSETPDEPSFGWDAKCRRVCSWAKLKNKQSGEVYVHINTHLDHIGEEARVKGLQMVLDFAAKFSEPVVLTGDFNFDEGCELYKQMTSGCLEDTKFAAEKTMNSITFNAFQGAIEDAEPTAIIDFINVTKGTKVNSYAVITDKPDGKFPSDHYPVMAEIDV